jgi:hypothetical protein
MKCPQCAIQRTAEHLFCGGCGYKFSYNCVSCGKPRISGNLFCGHCGHRHEASVSVPEPIKTFVPPAPRTLVPRPPVATKFLEFTAGVFDWDTFDESKRMTEVDSIGGIEEGVKYIQKRINDDDNDYGFSVCIEPADENLPNLVIFTSAMVMMAYDNIAKHAKKVSQQTTVTQDFLSVVCFYTGRIAAKHWLTQEETMNIVQEYVTNNGRVSLDPTWDQIED